MYKKLFVPLCLLVAASASAGNLTGTIHTMHVNIQTRVVHVQFDGAPVFDGGTCSVYWTGNCLDDADFMKAVYPLLIAAKAAGTPVTLSTSGCVNGFPKIYAIDLEPRLAT